MCFLIGLPAPADDGAIVPAATFGSELRVADCASEWPPKPVHQLDSSKFFQRDSGFANRWMTEAAVLYKRSTINLARDPLLTRARFFSTVFPAVLMGLIFLGLTNNQRSIQGKIGGLFFCIMNQSMISLFGVLQSFPVERAMFIREVQNGYYRYVTVYWFWWYCHVLMTLLPRSQCVHVLPVQNCV
jgi:ABC-2 type transporter